MKSFNEQINGKVNVKSVLTGLLVLFVLSLILFWGRFVCLHFLTMECMGEHGGGIDASVSINEMVPELMEKLRNVGASCWVDAHMVEDIFSISEDMNENILWHSSKTNRMVYFDHKTGRLVLLKVWSSSVEAERRWHSEVLAYAGPNGISESNDEVLGRFSGDILFSKSFKLAVLFDREDGRYYCVDFDNKIVRRSSSYEKSDDYGDPFELGCGYFVGLTTSPRRKIDKAVVFELHKRVKTYDRYAGDALVLNRRGQIYRLNLETMQFSGLAGAFDDKPENLFDYRYASVSLDGEYRGLVIMEFQRHLRNLRFLKFDANGKVIGKEYELVSLNNRAWYGKFTFEAIRYVLEMLNPPIFIVATYLTADHIGAIDGYRSLFLLSESWIGIAKRSWSDEDPVKLIVIMVTVSMFTILLVLFLVGKFQREARYFGLALADRRGWIGLIILFGLAAYITWRIVKPAAVMVTCKNCGKLRRTEFDKCQHCGADWAGAGCQSSAWRVVALDS